MSALGLARARRPGLQEKPGEADPVWFRLERNTACRGLVALWILPAAGLPILVGVPWWPWLGLVGGGVHVDAGGRAAAEVPGLRAGRVRTGPGAGFGLAMAGFGFLIVAGPGMTAASFATMG